MNICEEKKYILTSLAQPMLYEHLLVVPETKPNPA